MKQKERININEINLEAMSIVNDIGILFTWNGRLFRAIKQSSAGDIKQLFKCGLIKDLIENSLFPESWISDYEFEGYDLVVEHKKIKNVSYPYEWTFSMLKDAALAILKTNIIANKYAYETKDCHSFNIVFDGLQPQFVDLGSFIRVEPENNVWMAYEQFLKSYYYPMKLWSNGNSFIARSIVSSESEFITHDEYLLYKYPILRWASINLVRKYTNTYFKYKNIYNVSNEKLNAKLPKLLANLICYIKSKKALPFASLKIESLIKKTNRMQLKQVKSRWGAYHNEFYNEGGNFKPSTRFNRIRDIIKETNIKSVVELGGNQGLFSKLLLKTSSIDYAICTDYDENAVDLMYLSSKRDKTKALYPVRLNFILPVTVSKGRPAFMRFKSDTVIALAITHHLILTQQIRIDTIFEEISKYTKQYAIIEYMPLGLWDGKTADNLPSWYNIEWFRENFKEFFNLLIEEKLEENRILFMGELKVKSSI